MRVRKKQDVSERSKSKSRGASVTEHYAHAQCRISRYLDSMKALGYNPHVTIQIALAGNAADLTKHHDRAAQRGERLPHPLHLAIALALFTSWVTL